MVALLREHRAGLSLDHLLAVPGVGLAKAAQILCADISHWPVVVLLALILTGCQWLPGRATPTPVAFPTAGIFQPSPASGTFVPLPAIPTVPSFSEPAGIVASDTNLYQTPDLNAPVIGSLKKDQVVALEGRVPEGWVLVRAPNGQRGWAYTAYVTVPLDKLNSIPLVRVPGVVPLPTATLSLPPAPSSLRDLAAGAFFVQGSVRNAVTEQPIANASVYAGYNAVQTDANGQFRIAAKPSDFLIISAPDFEQASVQATPGLPIIVRLKPSSLDPRETMLQVYTYMRQGDYGRMYDMLHPDIQALFSRDAFIAYMIRTVDYQIVSVDIGPAARLPLWEFLGRTYTDVAEMGVHVSTSRYGIPGALDNVEHMAQSGGSWRWFRGPIGGVLPTPVPIIRTPTPPSGGYLPGARLEVSSPGGVNLRYGPGTSYQTIILLPAGTVVVVRSGPAWVSGTPWYEVQVPTSRVIGWVSAAYVRPAGRFTPTPPPTPTPTRTRPTPSPTQSYSPTPSPTLPPSPTASPTRPPSPTPSPTLPQPPSPTSSPSPTAGPTVTPSLTPTPPPTGTATPTVTQ